MDPSRSHLLVSLVMSCGLAAAAPSASAGLELYKANFEAPTFTAGLPLAGQDGWTAPPPLSPDAAVISTDKPRQGRQSVRVNGEDLVPQDFINEATGGVYDAIGSYRRSLCMAVTDRGCITAGDFTGFDTEGKKTIRVTAHVRVDGPRAPGGSNFFSASVGAIALGEEEGVPAPEGVGELAISSDGRVYGYTGADLVPTFLVYDRVTLNEWHTLSVVADFALRQTAFYVDDELLGVFPFDKRVTTNLLLRGSMLAYAAPDTAKLAKADFSAHFDQFVIEILQSGK